MSGFSFDSNKVQDFYDRYIEGHGIKAGWATQDDAINTYKQASSCSAQVWSDFESVLDAGSGQGHFMDFLRQKYSFTGKYTGNEIVEILHKEAVNIYGEFENTDWIHGEFLSHDFGSDKFDWVFSLGSLGVKQIPQKDCDLAFCTKMIELARYGISIFLNDVKHMRPGRLEEVPDLAAHDIDKFASMIQENFTGSKIEIKHYPEQWSQPTMVHVIL